jgi:hypothetical protein
MKEERAMNASNTSVTKAFVAKTFATALFAASLAPTGSAAMAAAASQARHPAKAAHVSAARTPVRHVAARTLPLPRNQLGLDIAAYIQGMLSGGPVPYANLVRDAQRMAVSRGSSYGSSESSFTPSYDNSGPASCVSCDAQAASDQEVQAIQQMTDTNAATAAAAAAEEQNDEANAATLQTEINAGM